MNNILSKKLNNWKWYNQALYYIRYGIWNWFGELKWRVPNALQRMWRGWGNADTWDFDNYLAKVIREGIKHLRDNLHGVPVDLGQKYKMEQAVKEWAKILNKMIRAFEIHTIWNDAARFPTEKEKEEYSEGWDLFKEYFGNLWD